MTRHAPSSREKASWRMPVKRSAANYEETCLLVCGNDVKLQLFVELLQSCLVRQGSAGGTLFVRDRHESSVLTAGLLAIAIPHIQSVDD